MWGEKQCWLWAGEHSMVEGIPVASPVAALTQWHQQETKVVEPVRRLAGQLFHEEPKDNTQVALVPCHNYLHWGGHVGVTVTAAKRRRKETVTDSR